MTLNNIERKEIERMVKKIVMMEKELTTIFDSMIGEGNSYFGGYIFTEFKDEEGNTDYKVVRRATEAEDRLYNLIFGM